MEGLTISFLLRVFSKAEPQNRLQSSTEVFLLLRKVDVVFLQEPKKHVVWQHLYLWICFKTVFKRQAFSVVLRSSTWEKKLLFQFSIFKWQNKQIIALVVLVLKRNQWYGVLLCLQILFQRDNIKEDEIYALPFADVTYRKESLGEVLLEAFSCYQYSAKQGL